MLRKHANCGIQLFTYHIHGIHLFLMTRPSHGESLTIIQDGR